jgi:tight adherence protein C
MDMMKSATVTMGVLTVALTVVAIALPILGGDSSRSRLRAIRATREKYRAEIKEFRKPKTVSMRERMSKKSFSQKLSERLRLSRFFNMDKMRAKLVLAGWRDPNTLPKFMIIHLILPFAVAGYLAFAIYGGALSSHVKPKYRPFVVLGGGLAGLMLPSILLSNAAENRKRKLSKQFPDALDLMLVCVEAGLSVEQSFMRITEEIGDSIPEVAEEFALTGAELSFLGDRPLAYVNLVARTQSPEFKGLSTALAQSEAYGTGVGVALRSLSEESRKQRMVNIEKAAGGLGPKMTIPMVLLILPCMFLILIGPAVIQVMGLTK